MNKVIILASTILVLSFLSSCSKETKDVQWYKEHPEVLKTEFEKCKLKTPPEVASDKHCMVIIQAQDAMFHQQQRNAPSPIIKFKHHEN